MDESKQASSDLMESSEGGLTKESAVFSQTLQQDAGYSEVDDNVLDKAAEELDSPKDNGTDINAVDCQIVKEFIDTQLNSDLPLHKDKQELTTVFQISSTKFLKACKGPLIPTRKETPERLRANQTLVLENYRSENAAMENLVLSISQSFQIGQASSSSSSSHYKSLSNTRRIGLRKKTETHADDMNLISPKHNVSESFSSGFCCSKTVPQPVALASEKRVLIREFQPHYIPSIPPHSASNEAQVFHKADLNLTNKASQDKKIKEFKTAIKWKPSASNAFKFKCSERAEKRKQFNRKLVEILTAKEREKIQIQAKTKEEMEAEIKELRKRSTFKATPMPKFYCKGAPPKIELRKIPTTRPKSPKLGRRSNAISTNFIPSIENSEEMVEELESMKKANATSFPTSVGDTAFNEYNGSIEVPSGGFPVSSIETSTNDNNHAYPEFTKISSREDTSASMCCDLTKVGSFGTPGLGNVSNWQVANDTKPTSGKSYHEDDTKDGKSTEASAKEIAIPLTSSRECTTKKEISEKSYADEAITYL